MPDSGLGAIVLAAGKGVRMGGEHPKVLYPICGRPMLHYVLDAVGDLRPSRVVLVVGHGREAVRAAVSNRPNVRIAVQEELLGTGHAVAQARAEFEGFEGTVLVLYGDTPGLRAEDLRHLVQSCPKGGVAFLAAELDRPRSYGRIVRDAAGMFVAIKEEKDASPSERGIRECNLGAYAFDAGRLFETLGALLQEPLPQGRAEYYLTDVVGRMKQAGAEVVLRRTEDPLAWTGVNTLQELVRSGRFVQDRILATHLARGVRIVDPSTTYIDWNVEIGEGTVVFPCTVIEGGTRIGSGCQVGPFAHLRPESVLRDRAEVGNFTEMKHSVLGEGSKAKHLSYLGDAEIGPGVNVGAGTITANWDGRGKARTTIEEGAFVGSGTVFVAPVTLGRGARTGAGAIVTKGTRVPDGETWVGVPARPLPTRAAAPEAGREKGKESNAARR